MKALILFLQLFKPYQGWLVTGVFLALISSLASISLLTLSGWFISSSAIAGIVATDGVAFAFNFMQPAAEIRALAIIRTLSRYGERLVTHEATFRVLAEIRCWFFAKLIPLAPGRLAMQRSADLLNGMTQDIDALDALYLRLCLPLLIAILGGGSVVVFLACYSVQMSLFVLAMLCTTVIFIPWFFNRLGRHSAKKLVEQVADLKIRQIEILQGIAELIAFNAYQRYKKQITTLSGQMMKTQTDNNRLSGLSSAITGFFFQITTLIAIVIASIAYQQGHISAPVLVMLSFCVLAMVELVMPLVSSVQLLEKMQSAAKRILGFTQLKPMITEPINAHPMPKAGGLKINNLSFRYTQYSDWILKNSELDIPQGRKIAIVGQSGVGKTTLLQLLMHFFDPQQGSIEYAGIDYKQFASDRLMNQFAVLPQQTQLFAATIKENLLIANPMATDMEIHQAITMAGLNNYIYQLPEGINTWVGENGAKISGGEARRISLARVYLKNAPVIFLDEPTEGLDKETENDVLTALEKIVKDKTLILVTHREVGLRLVEKVYTINKGQLKEI